MKMLKINMTIASILFIISSSVSISQTGQPMIMPNGVSVPSDFPHVNITTNSNPDPEYIFIDNRGGDWGRGNPYNIIFDNTGSPIWYLRTGSGDERRDFKVQPNGWLTMMDRYGYGYGGWGFIALTNCRSYLTAATCSSDDET
jgi:hypothetical protein